MLNEKEKELILKHNYKLLDRIKILLGVKMTTTIVFNDAEIKEVNQEGKNTNVFITNKKSKLESE